MNKEGKWWVVKNGVRINDKEKGNFGSRRNILSQDSLTRTRFVKDDHYSYLVTCIVKKMVDIEESEMEQKCKTTLETI